ncbi:MAG: 6-phosphofructokinase [Bacteroidia bacterium]|nr:6-phosphofructokinase [Bacteroidia bacterium]
MRKIGVFTSGGDSPGMNPCIRAVVRSGLHYGMQVVGIKHGYRGMIKGEFANMNARSVGNILQRGGTILKSSRSEEFRTVEGRKKAYENLKKHNIDGLVAIGGNGTFAGALALHQEYQIPVIGIPGTIDNDLHGTDFTLGFDTALDTVIDALDKIRDTADSHNRVFFVEVMGRDSGFIALISGLAGGAESILIPEMDDDVLNLIKTLNKALKRKKSSHIVMVAEGDEEGGAFQIADRVKREFRELDCRVVVLGHIQRGGSPSCNDRLLGTRLGVAAVEGLMRGEKNVMVGQIHNDVVYTPLTEAIKNSHKIDKNLFRLIDIMAK